MALDQVVEQILAEGRAEAQSIEDAAASEAEAVLAEARSEAQRGAQAITHEGATRADAQARRIHAASKLDAKKARLAAQADVLATVRTRVEDKLAKLPAKDRADLLRALVKGSAVVETLGSGARAWGRKDDRDAITSLGLAFAGETQCLGGLIVESADGTQREDLRFESILDEVWRDAVHDVAGKVFS